MIYCLNAVSQLSQYYFPCLIESGTQIREGAHVVVLSVSGDTEGSYDYIYILDADENELAKLDGGGISWSGNAAALTQCFARGLGDSMKSYGDHPNGTSE